jgi:hypothetical protein
MRFLGSCYYQWSSWTYQYPATHVRGIVCSSSYINKYCSSRRNSLTHPAAHEELGSHSPFHDTTVPGKKKEGTLDYKRLTYLSRLSLLHDLWCVKQWFVGHWCGRKKTSERVRAYTHIPRTYHSPFMRCIFAHHRCSDCAPVCVCVCIHNSLSHLASSPVPPKNRSFALPMPPKPGPRTAAQP